LAPENQEIRSAVLGATVTSISMVAYQVAAKATRDAFFLSNFPLQALPVMVIATSILAIAVAYAFTRALNAWGPERVIPAGFAGSAVLLLVEWAISFSFRRPAAILVYLHYGCFGALLISGFWSFLNERFDPRTARRVSGKITATGAAGGVAGGLIAAQVGRGLPVTAMIPVLAIFHFICAVAVLRLRPPRSSETVPATPTPGAASPASTSVPTRAEMPRRSHFRLLQESSYLRGLIALVFLVTLAEGWVDLVLKGRATLAMGHGGGLLQFFAAFYTGISLLTVVAQATLGRITLEKMGPARSAAILPTATAAAAATASVIPVLGTAAVARGVQSVLSNSLFRSGYEVLFTPVSPREKRAVKAMADVGASRLGDLLAASVAQVVVLVSMSTAGRILEGLAAITSIAAAWIAFRLHSGYSESLARGLVSRAIQLDLSEVRDATTRSALMQTMGPLALSQVQQRPRPGTWDTPAPTVDTDFADDADRGPEDVGEPASARKRDLQSRDPARVARALEAGPLESPLIPQVVLLLAWDDVARQAIGALRRSRPVGLELLVARLLDQEEDFTIRRRLPLVLGTYQDRAAVDGLVGALADRRFEVRYRSGRALAHLTAIDTSLTVTRDTVFQAVLREVQSGAGVWETRTLLDRMDDEGWSPVLDELVRERANRSLEHVFTLLALVFPRQPLQIAFRGLHTNDPVLHGTALEYLESMLPPEIRRPLWPYLEDKRPKRPGTMRPASEALRALLESSESIAIRLEELRRTQKTEEP
jgi:ATP/ADP translocase